MYNKIGITFDNKNQEAVLEAKKLIEKFGLVDLNKNKSKSIDCIVIIGGDGFALQTFHSFLNYKIPFYGINRGNLGFLMNEYKQKEDIIEKIHNAVGFHNYILKSEVTTAKTVETRYAINECSFLRSTSQAAKIKITINGIERMSKLVGDGLVVSSALGSTAYNFSVYGPILPINSKLISIMPISPFRPRYWRGAVVCDNSVIKVDILEKEKRSVNFSNDFNNICDIKSATISLDKSIYINLLFDEKITIEERLIREQFLMEE